MKTILSIICSKKVKYSLILIILLSLYISINAFSYATTVSSDISESVFRLHVIANSNTSQDQTLKYKVRDSLIEFMNNLCADATSKEEVLSIAKQHENDFKNIAQKTVYENGFNYDVFVEIGNFSFPTKEYGDISLPAGYYDALKVEIGNANGQNWWCVMFPPLCFVNVSSGIVPDESKQQMQNELSDESYSIISDSSNEFNFKFKLIEWLQNNNILTAKNN